MAEKTVLDFIEVIGNSNSHRELETYRLVRMISNPRIINGRVIITCTAVDVNVRKSGAWWWLKKLFGQEPIVGGLDLDKKREFSVDEDLFLQNKIGRPNTYIALPDRFEDLPESWKSHKYLGALFRLMYEARRSDRIKEEIMNEAGIQKAEQQDILSQSNYKFTEYMINTMKQFQDASETDLRKKVQARGSDQPQNRSDGYY